jgi:hypothetical protein
MRLGLYIQSWVTALLLGGALAHALATADAHLENGFALLASIVVCATHAIILVAYPFLRTKITGTLMIVMAAVSLFCVFLLTMASTPHFQLHTTVLERTPPKGPTLVHPNN